MHSGVARGGRSVPGGTFRGGGGKIEVIPKNLVRRKVFWGGEILGRGYKRAVDYWKDREAPKKDGQKILGYERKISRGGRHPSHATDYADIHKKCDNSLFWIARSKRFWG